MFLSLRILLFKSKIKILCNSNFFLEGRKYILLIRNTVAPEKKNWEQHYRFTKKSNKAWTTFFLSAKIIYIDNEVPEVLRIQIAWYISELVPKSNFNQSWWEPETKKIQYMIAAIATTYIPPTIIQKLMINLTTSDWRG